MTNLGRVLHRWRINEGLTLREAAKRTGIGSAATLMRIEHGQGLDASTLLKLLGWLMSEVPAGAMGEE